MIAPIVISAVVILYLVFYFIVLFSIIRSPFLKIALGIVPPVIGGEMIAVLIERIREIKGGEEDDLSQY